MYEDPYRSAPCYGARAYGQSAAVPELVRRVFLWMSAGLALTGGVAMAVAASPKLVQLFILNRPIFYLLLFGEIGIVLAMSWRARRMSATAATACFFAYAAVNGITMSVIFLAFTSSSIAQAFFITGGMFGAMAAWGYATRRDLTSMGQLFIMGVFGLIIASVVNWFLASPALDWAISVVGVVVFCGLTAYDMQKIKAMGYEVGASGEMAQKASIYGALNLYLDFINLFLMLLRLFGRRD